MHARLPSHPDQGFCKALVTFLYQHLIEHPPPGGLIALLQPQPSAPPPPSPSASPSASASASASPTASPSKAGAPLIVDQLVQVLRALLLLLDAEPPLMGLLASPSAVAPIAACLHPAALLMGKSDAAHQPLYCPSNPVDATLPTTHTTSAQNITAVLSHQSTMLLRLGHALTKQGCGIYASPWPSPCGHSPHAHHLSPGCTGEPHNTSDADTHQPPALSAADSLATSALQLLLHLSAHAGCQAAIVQEAATLRSLFWLVYRPTSQRCLQDAIKLLRAASGTDCSAQRTAFRPLRQSASRFTFVWHFKPAMWLSHPRLLGSPLSAQARRRSPWWQPARVAPCTWCAHCCRRTLPGHSLH